MKNYYLLRITFVNGEEKVITRKTYNDILRVFEKYRYNEKVLYIDCEGFNHKNEEENGWLFSEIVND